VNLTQVGVKSYLAWWLWCMLERPAQVRGRSNGCASCPYRSLAREAATLFIGDAQRWLAMR
jgi:hypothetical protein